MKTEMNLYFIESIHLKTLKGKKNGTNVPVQLQQPKKKKKQNKTKVPMRNLRVRSGEVALLLGSLGLLG